MSKESPAPHSNADVLLADDTLRRILHLATLAPSADHLQPWRFLVVRSKNRREILRRCAYGHPAITSAPVVLIVLGAHHPHRSHLSAIVADQVDRGELSPEQAKAITARTQISMESRDDPELWATRSAMLAAAALIAAARSLGVTPVYLDSFDRSKVREAFGIPEDHAVCCLIALGFGSEAKSVGGHLGLDEVCYLEHFGQPWTLGES